METMALQLYYVPMSSPCRLVLLVAAALNLKLDLNLIDMGMGDNFSPHFLKMNPQHTVPTLLDGHFALAESRAISRYLIYRYGANTNLYPTDPETRATVDHRLDFDLGTLYQRFSDYYYPIVYGGAPSDEGLKKKVEDALDIFNTILEGRSYAATSYLTLADLSLVATISTMEAAKIKLSPYPNIQKWFQLVKSTAPGYNEANQKGIDEFKKMIYRYTAKTEL